MRERKCCDECCKRRKKLSECRPRGPGRKCWTCDKWVRECSFVHTYPASLQSFPIELSREEKQRQRTEELRAIAVEKGILDHESIKRRRTEEASYHLAAAAANAAATALMESKSDAFIKESEAAAAGLAPKDAAQIALMAWAAASSDSQRLDLLADTVARAGAKSVVLRVPGMMCLGSCGATINKAIAELPDTRVAGINVTKRLVHCHTPTYPENLVEVLSNVGFDASVVSISRQSAPLADGSLIDNLHEDEWEIADALGLVSAVCSRRNGGACSCGPSCMCHYCPTHHPDRAASLSTVAKDPE